MKKWILRIAAGIVVLLVAAFLIRNVIARQSVKSGVQKITGFPVEVGSVDVAPFGNRIELKDVKMSNPPEFPEKLFVDLPLLTVDYRLGSMLGKHPHINDLQLHLKEMVIVKNEKGETNLRKLKGIGSGKEPSSSTNTVKFRIDVLHVKVGSVTFKDYTQSPPSVRTIPVNLDKTYRDITEGTDINRLVLLTIMSKITLPELGVDFADLTKGLGPVKDAAGEILKSSTHILKEGGQGVLDILKRGKPERK